LSEDFEFDQEDLSKKYLKVSPQVGEKTRLPKKNKVKPSKKTIEQKTIACKQ
jgi:hypothetical protein